MSHTKWNYQAQGEWAHLPGCSAKGTRQSPISIQLADVVESKELSQLKLTGWEKPFSGKVNNNGHSIQFNPSTHHATLQNHRGTYVMQQFHFHWGRCSNEGSEHVVGGRQYDLEVHFVHKKEGGADDASDALSVLAVFGEEDSTISGDTGVWKQLIVPQHYDKSVSVDAVDISLLLPKKQDFFYYEGSLTTPPCSEIVQWFILKESIKIPQDFLEKLRHIEDDEGKILSYNYREVQPINERKVATPAL